MSISRAEYPDLDIDIEIEILSALIKFFPHKGSAFFGQVVINTALLNEAILKGLESPKMSFKRRKNLNESIRRTVKKLGYKGGCFQRKKGEKVTTIKIDLN
jgi:hypothetical protein